METIILTYEDVKELLTMKETIEAVERAFELHGKGLTQMPPKVYLSFEKGDLRAMPAYLEGKAGIKWVNSHPENPKKGLPTVMAVLILNDPETGYPIAIMDGTHITNFRTGAAGAVASKYLARKDSKVFGFVGCGRQAYTQFLALKEIFEIEEVRAYDINEKNAEKFVEFCRKWTEADVKPIEDVCDCDVLTTTTPSRKPVVMNDWIREGTHINAIGADAPGKQELDEKILLRAKIVVDDLEQAIHGGEINVAISKGILKPEDIYASLGEIVAGLKAGRESNDGITVFDSTGLAIQDIAVAKVVYDRAVETGKGLRIDLFRGLV
ncbi:alanine dehydrogenase [Archaeoglobus profundus]|uniref:Alanine dehydrogenase n=1 Tax=Archaeoglobus profundus (strain DSM 5631 / JCM 9629 / NBRC 100127 / Av18) TaxID=572546 RepID=D2RES0_ARCPA|nr:alanine dehydrogenase [Archaeoglobus profundus]ADB58614.1 alanine dehydrogenase [Archaeoglobus profundus DSM 5631]